MSTAVSYGELEATARYLEVGDNTIVYFVGQLHHHRRKIIAGIATKDGPFQDGHTDGVEIRPIEDVEYRRRTLQAVNEDGDQALKVGFCPWDLL